MTTHTLSGTELTLSSGDYTARVVTVGAGLAGLDWRGHRIVLPHGADQVPPAYMGKVLVPWPNRIAGGAYTWQGRRYNVPVNEPELGTALHGLAAWTDWRVVHADSDSATLGLFVAPTYGYPWPLQAWATYAVDAARGLSVTVSTKNTGQAAAPYGTGVHPYLTVDGHPADSYELTVPASSALTTDASLIPTGRVAVDEAGVDFREPALIGGRSIDHAFTDIRAGGAWTASILHRGTGIGAAITADTPWVQVYSGEHVPAQRLQLPHGPGRPGAGADALDDRGDPRLRPVAGGCPGGPCGPLPGSGHCRRGGAGGVVLTGPLPFQHTGPVFRWG